MYLGVPHGVMAGDNSWETYRAIRLQSEKEPREYSCDDHGNERCSSSDSVGLPQKTNPQLAENAPPNWKKIVHCPDTPTFQNGAGARWYFCDVNIATEPYYTPYDKDFPISYMIPREDNFQDARVRVYLHPDSANGAYVTGPSSFAFRQDTVEIHPMEQQWGNNGYTGWWLYSGNEVGTIANYNGRQIALGIDYIMDKYSDKIDLGKGIYLVGKSLGGAGVMHQSMILPKYQDKIAIVDGIIARMMIPKNGERAVKRAWGTKAVNPELYDSVDIRLQYDKVKDIHFMWRGGSNDSLGRFDIEFLQICEQRKISCSATWLLSGHGISEAGYSLNMQLWTDPNQDATLDKILPVITNNTSNYHGRLRGYHNRGITWNHKAIVDQADRIVIPLQYRAMTNLGSDLPDQPQQVMFSVTLRHVKNFTFQPGDEVQWQFGQQRGTTTIALDGLLTIDGLRRKSSQGYQELVIKLYSPQ